MTRCTMVCGDASVCMDVCKSVTYIHSLRFESMHVSWFVQGPAFKATRLTQYPGRFIGNTALLVVHYCSAPKGSDSQLPNG